MNIKNGLLGVYVRADGQKKRFDLLKRREGVLVAIAKSETMCAVKIAAANDAQVDNVKLSGKMGGLWRVHKMSFSGCSYDIALASRRSLNNNCSTMVDQ